MHAVSPRIVSPRCQASVTPTPPAAVLQQVHLSGSRTPYTPRQNLGGSARWTPPSSIASPHQVRGGGSRSPLHANPQSLGGSARWASSPNAVSPQANISPRGSLSQLMLTPPPFCVSYSSRLMPSASTTSPPSTCHAGSLSRPQVGSLPGVMTECSDSNFKRPFLMAHGCRAQQSPLVNTHLRSHPPQASTSYPESISQPVVVHQLCGSSSRSPSLKSGLAHSTDSMKVLLQVQPRVLPPQAAAQHLVSSNPSLPACSNGSTRSHSNLRSAAPSVQSGSGTVPNRAASTCVNSSAPSGNSLLSSRSEGTTPLTPPAMDLPFAFTSCPVDPCVRVNRAEMGICLKKEEVRILKHFDVSKVPLEFDLDKHMLVDKSLPSVAKSENVATENAVICYPDSEDVLTSNMAATSEALAEQTAPKSPGLIEGPRLPESEFTSDANRSFAETASCITALHVDAAACYCPAVEENLDKALVIAHDSAESSVLRLPQGTANETSNAMLACEIEDNAANAPKTFIALSQTSHGGNCSSRGSAVTAVQVSTPPLSPLIRGISVGVEEPSTSKSQCTPGTPPKTGAMSPPCTKIRLRDLDVTGQHKATPCRDSSAKQSQLERQRPSALGKQSSKQKVASIGRASRQNLGRSVGAPSTPRSQLKKVRPHPPLTNRVLADDPPTEKNLPSKHRLRFEKVDNVPVGTINLF